MTLKQYNWKDGPDLIQQHSVAKHRILQAYLAAYFRTLVSSPNQDVLKLTLVDGFAGGGLYVHNDTREPVKGSPFIFLEAARGRVPDQPRPAQACSTPGRLLLHRGRPP